MAWFRPVVKRVLHIITGLEEGGAEAVLYRLCTHDAQIEHHVVSLGGEGKYGPLLKKAGLRVTYLNMPRGRLTFQGVFKLWKIIRITRPKAIQTWMYHANLLGGFLARLAGCSNLVWGIRQTELNPEQSSLLTRIINKISAVVSGKVPRAIVCCAERAAEHHIKCGYDFSKITVIPNGYDFTQFQPNMAAAAAFRAELAVAENVPLIGFVARFNPIKDHQTLLSALAHMHAMPIHPVCILVGFGMDDQNSELMHMIDHTGVGEHVRLLGPRTDIPNVMNGLDVHVMSSVTEGFPNVLAEAMACGTPCVSTDVGDAKIILGEAGATVPISSPLALANAVMDMLAERELDSWPQRQALARKQVVDNFSIERMIGLYHQVWSDCTT